MFLGVTAAPGAGPGGAAQAGAADQPPRPTFVGTAVKRLAPVRLQGQELVEWKRDALVRSCAVSVFFVCHLVIMLVLPQLASLSRLIFSTFPVGSRQACAKREVNVLNQLHHTSIIRVLGYALPRVGAAAAADVDLADMLQVCLIYELAPERGLDGYLANDAKAELLAWDDRVYLLVQVCRTWIGFVFISIRCLAG